LALNQQPTMHILELQNLKKYFATQKAVDDISFGIETILVLVLKKEAYLECLAPMAPAKPLWEE